MVIKDRPVVFHYYGPSNLKKTAKKLAKSGKKFLIEELNNLEARLKGETKDSHPFFRKTYLISQVRSLRGMLELNGTKLSGIDLLEGIAAVLGIVPPFPYDIKELRSEEQIVLKKYGYDSYKEFQIEQDKKSWGTVTDDEIKDLIDQLKNISIKDVLPNLFLSADFEKFLDSSNVTLARPKKGYPPCYYLYKGKGLAEVSLSKDHKKRKLTAVRTLMHEVYPGHHLYYLYREALSGLGLMGDETMLDLVYSAETPMSEGVAEIMPYYLESFEEGIRRPLEITTAHEHFCKKALYNVWYYKFVNQIMSGEAAKAYLHECGFDNEQVDTWLNFIDEWRLYYPSYPVGTESVRKYLKNTGDGLTYLYLPKTFSVLEKLQQPRRLYEESSSQAVLCNAGVVKCGKENKGRNYEEDSR